MPLRPPRSLAELEEALAARGLEDLCARPLSDWAEHADLGPEESADLGNLAEALGIERIEDLLALERREVVRVRGGLRLWNVGIPRLLPSLIAWAEREAGGRGLEAGAPARVVPGMPREALRAWATARGVESVLTVEASVVGDHLSPYDRSLLWSVVPGTTVEDLVCAETGPRRSYRARWEPTLELQRGAVRVLEEAAAAAQRGLAWEREVLLPRRPATDDPALLALWARLQRARAEIRPESPPRAIREAWRQLSLEDDPPVLVYEERVKAWCGGGRQPVVEVDLRAEPAARVTCDCPAPAAGRPDRRGRCGVALSALDASLDLLAMPGEPGDAARAAIRTALATAPWERTLGELDRVLARPRPQDGKGRQLGWRIAVDLDGRVRIEPALCAPFAGRPGLRVAALALPTLREERWRCETEVDSRVLDLLPNRGEHLPRADQDRRVLRAVELLVEHPRVVLGRTKPDHVRVRRAVLGFSLAPSADGGLDLLPQVDGASQDPGALLGSLALSADGQGLALSPAEQRVTLLALGAEGLDLLGMLARRGAHFPAEAAAPLMARLPVLAERVTLDLSAGLGFEEVTAEPRLVLRVEAQPDATLRLAALLRPIEDAPAQVPGEGPERVWVLRDQGYRVVRRDLPAEPDLARALLADLALPLPPGDDLAHAIADPEVALGVLAALRDQAERCTVEWAGTRPEVTRSALSSDLNVAVGAQRDWFGLGGELVVDGHSVPFAEVMQAVFEGRRFVRATGQAWVQLGRPFLERLQALGDHVELSRGALRVAPVASSAIEALERAGARLDAPAAWRGWLERIQRAGQLEPAVPAALAPILRPYQAAAFVWLVRTASWSPGACLADDMGLGKTLQALALLVERAPLGPALVVAPTSVGLGWLREAERFTPGLRLRLLRGPDRARLVAALGAGDVGVTSYALLARDEALLAGRRFATLVLDEAQAIKNPDTLRARAARAIEAEFRLALTGTPVENRTSELWSVFRATVPGLLGSWPHFRERFAVPIERDRDEERRRALAAVVRPFVLRRLKREVEPELPERTEVQLTLDLEPAERAFYEQLRLAALAGLSAGPLDDATGRFQVLAALTRLRQAACHPRLVDPASKLRSTKLQVLRERIAALRENGHRALVFSQFTTLLGRARRALEQDGVRCRYLDGALSPVERQAEVDAFQAGEADAFLISLKAGGTGLNLTAATYVFHLDPWWNPAVEDQATDRAHRIGQRHPVTVYRLVARGTVEEAILDLHASKRALVAGLLEGTGAATKLATEELVDLLRFGGGLRDDDPVEADEGEALAEPDDEPPVPALRLVATGPAEPVPPERPGPRVAPAPGSIDLRGSLDAWSASAPRDLAPSSLGVYRRAAGRLIAWAEARRRSASDAGALIELLAAYRADVEVGAWPDSPSTVSAASAAVGRWSRWLVARR